MGRVSRSVEIFSLTKLKLISSEFCSRISAISLATVFYMISSGEFMLVLDNFAMSSSFPSNFSCATLRYTLPTDVLFWHYHLLPSLGEKIYEAITDLELQGNPLIFHVFSGCGCAVFNAFRRYCIRTGESDLNIAGVIYDSAPAATSYYQVSHRLPFHPIKLIESISFSLSLV